MASTVNGPLMGRTGPQGPLAAPPGRVVPPRGRRDMRKSLVRGAGQWLELVTLIRVPALVRSTNGRTR